MTTEEAQAASEALQTQIAEVRLQIEDEKARVRGVVGKAFLDRQTTETADLGLGKQSQLNSLERQITTLEEYASA